MTISDTAMPDPDPDEPGPATDTGDPSMFAGLGLVALALRGRRRA